MCPRTTCSAITRRIATSTAATAASTSRSRGRACRCVRGAGITRRRARCPRRRLPSPRSRRAPAGLTDALGVLARLRADATLFVHGAIDGAEAQSVDRAWQQPVDVVGGGRRRAGQRDRRRPARRSGRRRARSTRARAGRPCACRSAPRPTGPLTFRVTAKTGSAPAVDGRVDARPNPSTLIGDAVVFRASPAGTSPLRPVADFQFRRTERVHVEWPIRGTLDRREARLLNRSGQPLAVPVTRDRARVGRPAHAGGRSAAGAAGRRRLRD